MSAAILRARLADPFAFAELCWPDRLFYGKQVEVIESVRDNFQTFVQAGNKLGKDYVAGFIALWYFLAHRRCRVVTTSVKDDHLRVLWSEIMGWVNSSRLPLRVEHGGPLLCQHREIKKVIRGKVCDISYLIGSVSEKGEGMAGHHAPDGSLAIGDEASGIDDQTFNQMTTWAERILMFGNPLSSAGFFFNGCEGGDILEQAS